VTIKTTILCWTGSNLGELREAHPDLQLTMSGGLLRIQKVSDTRRATYLEEGECYPKTLIPA
jgi:hypothetical protein